MCAVYAGCVFVCVVFSPDILILTFSTHGTIDTTTLHILTPEWTIAIQVHLEDTKEGESLKKKKGREREVCVCVCMRQILSNLEDSSLSLSLSCFVCCCLIRCSYP